VRYVYGPVPSRRLGRSLGIDPVPPKTCNWNCVYCQLGRTTPVSNERRELAPREEVLDEVESAFIAGGANIDWVTFVGSGEPTLHAGLGRMIREVRAMVRVPIAVITNGALLHRSDVRRQLAVADAIMPSLDAGSEELYHAINRPFPGLTLEQHVEGLVAFQRSFAGRLWVEVMLVAGLNDGEAALRDLATALRRIEPDEVHINVPTRPPAEPWVKAPEAGVLERARSLLGVRAHVVLPVVSDFEVHTDANIAEAVAGIVARHPLSEQELLAALSRHWAPDEVTRALRAALAGGSVQVIERLGQRFWTAALYRYGCHPPGPGPLRDGHPKAPPR
jgi:wyosine [tRNA(Phe)-imidazoG37] synthetase (radical SAM superfamily)